MKKFIVSVNVLTCQTVDYEVIAKDRDELTKMLSEDSVSDIGVCVEESVPELYSETIDNIREVDFKKGGLK